MTLYERIRQLRINAGMSQDDLAKAMGYKDRSMITKIESGKVDISQKKIVAFARVLNSTTSYLMGWDDNSESSSTDSLDNADEIRIVIPGIRKLSTDQLERAKNAFRAMLIATYPEIFDAEKEKSP